MVLALKRLHDAQLFHLNLKPENVFRDAAGFLLSPLLTEQVT